MSLDPWIGDVLLNITHHIGVLSPTLPEHDSFNVMLLFFGILLNREAILESEVVHFVLLSACWLIPAGYRCSYFVFVSCSLQKMPEILQKQFRPTQVAQWIAC